MQQVDRARASLWANLTGGTADLAVLEFSWGQAGMTRPGVLKAVLEEARASGASSVSLLPLGGGRNKSLFDGLLADGLRAGAGAGAGPGWGLEVRLPLSLLEGELGAALPEMQLVAAVLAADKGSELATGRLGARSNVLAAALVELRVPDRQLNVSQLTEPIQIALPVQYRQELLCAFWDEKEWSMEGVEVSDRSRPGSQLWCDTYHLSLFAAILRSIVDTVLCSNFHLLTPPAFAELGKGQWFKSGSAIMCFLLLSVLLLLFIAAALLDARRKRWTWRVEFLLLEEEPTEEKKDFGPEESMESSEVQAAPADAPAASKLCAFCGACSGIFTCIGQSSAFKEALDDILENWCEWASQVRGILDSMSADMETRSCSCFSHAFLVKISTHLLVLSSRRMTAFSAGLSDNVVSFVMQNKDLSDYLMDEHLKQRIREREARKAGVALSERVTWSRAMVKNNLTQAESWQMLHDKVSEHMLQHTHRTSRQVMRSVLMILLSNNPVSVLFLFDLFVNCKQRVLLLAADLMGALALSCLFFQTGGLVRGKPIAGGKDCGGEEDSENEFGAKIGRFLVIATGSLLIAGLPVILLESLLTKDLKKISAGLQERQLRVWAVQERVFWCLGSLHLGFCTLFVILFLANIGEQDLEDWFSAGGLAMLQDLVLLPIGMALVIPFLVRSILLCYRFVTKKDPVRLHHHACEQLHRTSNLMLPITQT